MKIAIGADHAGFEVKEQLKNYLKDKGHQVADFGTYSNGSCDYPDYAFQTAKAVADKLCDRAILVCGTGIGVSICANKVKGVRCGLCHDLFTAKMCREHNDANCLAVGARVVELPVILQMVDVFLSTDFLGDKHARRIEKINKYEQ
ncbi:MAG: ribose 5-phosphate isomerase B [Clostridia bacterium]|nr:ribose 5-phosphate isomerase B [Clostridia bacterium]MBQ6883172.1 ribose 5-phosphate isomerase B [Clostridia bacterium]MBR2933760.1 ribose 5-phosphate isomerase B [Clostridia bacterium]MBR6687265.1 ribose 5-phosphate isomerase B [Clostridia bacterium]